MAFLDLIRTAAADDDAIEPEIGFTMQLKIMMHALWDSPIRTRLILLATALLTIILVTAFTQILLNQWNAPFYDALARKDVTGLLYQLQIFAYIASALLLLNVVQTWLNQMTAVGMREGLSRDLVRQWLEPKRAMKLAASGSVFGVNPDQRLHEDSRHLSEITTSLAIGLVQATIMLFSFVGVLWQLSSGFVFHVGGVSFSIPGYMVWAAVLYAGSASLISALVGRRLVHLNALRYSKEAELRSSLMRTNESLVPVALLRGEENERHHIDGDISAVLSVLKRLAMAYTNLTWVTSAYGWLTLIVPILIAAPVYFSGGITFGGLMVAVGAFNQVHASLRWYVDNFNVIADWKATLLRVANFRHALQEVDLTETGPGTLAVAPSEDHTLVLDHVQIASTANPEPGSGSIRLSESDVVVREGERIMINGDPTANRKLLFAALAEIWPWGSGRIGLPPVADIMFVPQESYIAQGSLREVLAYPAEASSHSDEDIKAALTRVNLEKLATSLDNRTRWSKALDKDEQLCLVFANALLRRPKWIVFDDVLEGLEPRTQTLLSGLMHDMTDTAMIYVGRAESYVQAVSPRILHLEVIPVTPAKPA